MTDYWEGYLSANSPSDNATAQGTTPTPATYEPSNGKTYTITMVAIRTLSLDDGGVAKLFGVALTSGDGSAVSQNVFDMVRLRSGPFTLGFSTAFVVVEGSSGESAVTFSSMYTNIRRHRLPTGWNYGEHVLTGVPADTSTSSMFSNAYARNGAVGRYWYFDLRLPTLYSEQLDVLSVLPDYMLPGFKLSFRQDTEFAIDFIEDISSANVGRDYRHRDYR